MNLPASSSDSSTIDQLRVDTPGCSRVVHLNNAGSALPPAIVVDTMVKHLRLEEMLGGYEALQKCNHEFEMVYRSIATLLELEAREHCPDTIGNRRLGPGIQCDCVH